MRLFTTLLLLAALAPALSSAELQNSRVAVRVAEETGACEIVDKAAGVTWRTEAAAFGEVTLIQNGKAERVALTRPVIRPGQDALHLEFAPVEGQRIRVEIRLVAGAPAVEFSYSADAAIESIRMLDRLFVTGAERGFAVVPAREGLLIPADSGLNFTHTFDTYAYEGCHMQMLGLGHAGAAAMLTWSDPYVAAELRSAVTNLATARQVLSTSLVLRKSARSFRLHLLGRGDYNTIGQAYRSVARERGLLVPWEQKIKENPSRARYLGASNYKLWSVLDRRMNEESSKEESVRVNWTFNEAAQVAEHLKRDLKLDKVLFMMGGWIRRGYDNQHPDILPTAPECGGDTAFRDACERIRKLGYILSLHDNYQDIYRDSPSWNERWIQKTANGGLTKGGHWAGGVAYITCSKMALELAQRPQNLPAVKALSGADSYFIDTTYATGLQECFDPAHPLTRADDLRWKQAISDYARGVFGSFGSECGREWAIPHADFFEGLTGVSGTYYHNKDLVAKLGATVIPLFEMVYRDTIALYGKYGYDPAQAAEYVLHHIAIGRPLHYHNIPNHLYWKAPDRAAEALKIRPSIFKFEQTAPRQFALTYRWIMETKLDSDAWRVFVHFTDASGSIKFQNDHSATIGEALGQHLDGPHTIKVPAGLDGPFEVRIGLFDPKTGQRARLVGRDNGERSYLVGRIKVAGDKVTLEPGSAPVENSAGDPGLYVRGDGGWTEGLHSYDRFVKNTHEILSPFHELTAQMTVTSHQFLDASRRVQRTVFGEGAGRIEAVVNGSREDYLLTLPMGGDVLLPPNGFAIESARFVAFCALRWNGQLYPGGALFTLRSLDEKPMGESRKIRVFHGFGDPRIKLGARVERVEKERVVE